MDVTVADGQAIETYSDTDRWTGSINVNWTPLPNFTHKATVGLDALNDQKTRTLPFGRHYTYIGKSGERNIGYRNTRVFTGDYLATLDSVGRGTGTYNPTQWLQERTLQVRV